MEQNIGRIGQSVIVKGELSAAEDLTIDGQVDGKVELRKNALTIGQSGRVTAEVLANVVIVMGKVKGTITATETITIRETASVDGELVAPRVAIAEGAFFRGHIDMGRSEAEQGKGDNSAKKAQTRHSSATRANEPQVPLVASPTQS